MTKKLEESLERIQAAMEARESSKGPEEGERAPRMGERDDPIGKNLAVGNVVDFQAHWNEEERAIPNAIARSSLFAPIRRGRRVLYDEVLVASRRDVSIRYAGHQLDMADQDVWLILVELAKNYPIGKRIEVSRYEILKALGRNTGKSAYVWLHGAIKRLIKGTVFIKAKRYQAGLHLIESFELDEKTGKYFMRLNPELVKLYSKSEYALIDWGRRQALKKHVDLAKWLQSYVASHKHGEEHRIGLERLKEWSGAKSEMWDFKQDLLIALAELKRLGEIENPRIEGDVVVWRRP